MGMFDGLDSAEKTTPRIYPHEGKYLCELTELRGKVSDSDGSPS